MGERGAQAVFRRAGVEVKPGACISLYGPPGVGKTCLSLALAKELKRRAVLVATEPNLGDEDFLKLVRRYAPQDVDFVDVIEHPTPWRIWYQIKRRLDAKEPCTLILDSLSALVDSIAISEHMLEPRVLAARASTAVRAVAYMARQLANRTSSVVVLIAQATSTAGTEAYRGRHPERPAFTRRVDHYVSHELWLRLAPDDPSIRLLTCTLHRANPWLEGRTAAFRFAEDTVELVEEEKKEKKGA